MQTAAIKFERFQHSADEECQRRIIAAREKFGERLVILGHHYQQEGVYKHADYTGDSLKLSRQASQVDAEYIVFQFAGTSTVKCLTTNISSIL